MTIPSAEVRHKAADVTILPDYDSLCEHVAALIADLVRAKPQAVLGLATGATPRGVYDALVRRHRHDRLDFGGVTCFNLDEYYPMPPDDRHSYHRFMRTHLFDGVNCTHWHVPDGRSRGATEIQEDCRRYEAAIEGAGGIDLQLLGIGRNGHIGFNEPGSSSRTRTRLVSLHHETREDAAKDFGSLERVPAQAVTMGIGTILAARRIILLASGEGKAEIVRAALEGAVTEQLPASFLQTHRDVQVCLNGDAARLLSTA